MHQLQQPRHRSSLDQLAAAAAEGSSKSLNDNSGGSNGSGMDIVDNTPAPSFVVESITPPHSTQQHYPSQAIQQRQQNWQQQQQQQHYQHHQSQPSSSAITMQHYANNLYQPAHASSSSLHPALISPPPPPPPPPVVDNSMTMMTATTTTAAATATTPSTVVASTISPPVLVNRPRGNSTASISSVSLTASTSQLLGRRRGGSRAGHSLINVPEDGVASGAIRRGILEYASGQHQPSSSAFFVAQQQVLHQSKSIAKSALQMLIGMSKENDSNAHVSQTLIPPLSIVFHQLGLIDDATRLAHAHDYINAMSLSRPLTEAVEQIKMLINVYGLETAVGILSSRPSGLWSPTPSSPLSSHPSVVSPVSSSMMVSPLVSGSTTAHFGHVGNGAATPLSPHLHQPQPSPSTGVTAIIVPSSMQLISPTSTTTPTLSKKQAAAMREANIGYMQLIAPNNPSNSIVLVGNHYSRADVTAAINDTPEPCVLRLRELSEKACDDSILAALHGNAGIREVHIERCLGITFFGVVALLRSLRPRVAALTYIAHPASSPPENSMINALLGSLSKKNTLRLYLDFPRGNYAHYYMTIVTEFVNLQALGYHFRTPVRFAPSLSATSVSVVSSSTGASSETASTTSASDQQRSAPGRSLIWLSIILPANLGTVAGQTMSSLRTLIVYGVNEDDDIGAMRGEEITRLFKARTPGARVGSGNDSPPWHANLRNLLLVQCASIQESVLTEISGSCPQIERIVVDGCKHATTAGGMNLLRDLTKLTHLSIAGSTSIGSKTLLKRPVSTLAGLQYLHIQYTQFYMEQANTVFFNMPQLRTLYFDNSDFSATVSRHLATPQSSSTSSDAADQSQQQQQQQQQQRRQIGAPLEEFRLTGATHFDETAVRSILEIPTLKKLTLRGTRHNKDTIERMCTLQNRTDVVLDVDTSMADPLLTHPMLERFFDGISVADLVAQAGLQLYVDIDDPSDVAFEDDSSMDVVITPIVPPARRNRPKVSPLHNVVDSSSQDGFGGSALVSPSLSNGISPSATISPITQQMSRTSLISGTVDSAVSMVSNSHSDTMVSTAQLSPLPHVSATLATNRYRSNSDVNAGKRALRHRGSIQNAGQSRLGLVSDIAPPPLRGSSDELQYSSSISHSAATSPALLAEPPHSPRSPYSQHHQPPLSSPHRLQHRSSVHQFPLPYQRPSTSSTSMSAGRRHSRVQSSISNSYNDHARFQDTSEFMAPVHSDQRQPGPQAVPPTQQVGYSYGSVEDVRMAGDSNDIIEPSWLPSPVGQRYIRPPGQLPQPPPLHQRPVLPQPPQSQPQPQPQPQLHASASTSPPVYFDGTPYSPHATATAAGSSYTHQQVSRQTSQTPLYQSYQSQLQPPQNYAQSGPLSSPQTVTRIRLPPPTPTTPLHYTSQSN